MTIRMATGRRLTMAMMLAPLLACEPWGAPGEAELDGVPAEEVAAAVEAPAPPKTVGLDGALIDQALTQAEALPRLRTLLVSRHGELLVERHFGGPGPDQPANVKSVSKSVLSAAIGIAIAEGALESVDQPIAPFFERHLRSDEDPRKRRITIGNLLSMQSGLERTSGALYGRWVTSRDWVAYAVGRPMVADPGDTRLYSTGNTHLLSALLTEATGRSTWAYLQEKLAEPLGVSLPRWPTDPQGIYFGGNEMRMTPRALIRFGELYRNGGRHEGRQIVPEAWVQESLTPRSRIRRGSEGYGYGWFLSSVRGHPMFYAWGYGGQFIFVVPDLELTVVTTSNPDVEREGDHLRAVRQILQGSIVPAAEVGLRPAEEV